MKSATLHLINTNLISFKTDSITQRISRWILNYKSRRQLLSLSGHQLSDIGVSRFDAVKEANKSFWE